MKHFYIGKTLTIASFLNVFKHNLSGEIIPKTSISYLNYVIIGLLILALILIIVTLSVKKDKKK